VIPLASIEREGIPESKIFFVGNVMIDSLLNYSNKTENSIVLKKLGLQNNNNTNNYVM
jgi:UDP-N-acetylglucosamine 2-epimerase (non-hydrolysing)